MNEDIKKRLRQAMIQENINPHQIANGDQTLENKISRQLRNTAMTVETFMQIVSAMPKINHQWLLTGVGDMYGNKYVHVNDETTTTASEPETPKYVINENVMVTVPLSLLNDLQEQIKIKDKQIFQILALKK